jgi:dTDP-glucose 4,6-dehydratase
MRRVLLTGAGGFCGAHALEHFLATTDWQIVCTDSFRHKGKTDRIREVLAGRPEDRNRVRVVTHDLRAPLSVQLAREIGPVDYLVSMASESHVDRSITEPRQFIENNVQLVLSLLDYARTVEVEKFLHISTDEVYGPAPVGHDHAEGEPHRPSNPYSASKAAQEAIIYSYWRTYGMPCGISNTMNIIGERQDPEKFVPLVLSRVLKGETVPIHASPQGEPGSRFYLHARNQADALRFLLETQRFPRYADGADIGRWNVVGEVEVDNLRMAEKIAEYAHCSLIYDLVDFHSQRPGHDLRYALDGSKMHTLGWTPPLPLFESLRRTVEWTMAHPEWLLADD